MIWTITSLITIDITIDINNLNMLNTARAMWIRKLPSRRPRH